MKYKTTDLFVALSTGDYDLVEPVVDSGINLNTKWRGNTPLYFAICHNFLKITELLVSRGSSVNQPCSNSLRWSEPPLVAACRMNSLNIVKVLLNSPIINVDQVDFFGKGALYYAVLSKNLEVVKLLLDHGANINIAKNAECCPLYLSVHRNKGRIGIAHLLIRRGCESDFNVYPPIQYEAVKNRNLETFELLLQSGLRITHEWALWICKLYPEWQKDEEFCNRIHSVWKNPSSLQNVAVVSIRRLITRCWGNLKVEQVSKLPIPGNLKDALQLMN